MEKGIAGHCWPGEKGKNLLEFHLDLGDVESWWLESPFPPKHFQELGWIFQAEGIFWDRECGGSGNNPVVCGAEFQDFLSWLLHFSSIPAHPGVEFQDGLAWNPSWIPGILRILHRLRIPG